MECSTCSDEDTLSGWEEGEEEGEEIDVVGVAPSTVLPYDEKKVSIYSTVEVHTCLPPPSFMQVSGIMVECARHINLVRSPAENSDLLVERVMSGCNFQQKTLLQKLYTLLQNEHLARLSMVNVSRE